jgi:cell wall-associated NlpC family hydrolase
MSEKWIRCQQSAPDRVEVRDANDNWLATFTTGSYTVTVKGPNRTLREKDASVIHAVWVRSYPVPFAGEIEQAWLDKAIDANDQSVPDVIAVSMQYILDAPPIFDGDLQIAGNASYGPLVDGKRQEGSDFNDYLGVVWPYPGEAKDRPEPHQFRCLDCSGFVRMIWGYRHHMPGAGYSDSIPLCRDSRPDRSAIPRRAFEICESAPGVLIVPDNGVQVTDFSRLNIGDLVFFDADEDDGPQIDHVGMYLGIDVDGRHRFISSRKAANGPTLGDFKGKSVLDGRGLYARSFRAVRRL